MSAERCAKCRRMDYDVKRVAVLVDGRASVEIRLCRACRSEAFDHLLPGKAA